MNIFKVAYEPEISNVTRSFIRDNITPSMTSDDNTSNQYNLDFVCTLLEETLTVDKVLVKEYEYLLELLNSGVNFIEF